MNAIFKTGDLKHFQRTVRKEDVAAFNEDVVHPIYATFALARDAEWTSRQFVLEMRAEDEEGIGTFIAIDHKAPAFVGEEINFVARVEEVRGNELICSFEARVGQRLIATGQTGQKILSKKKLEIILRPPAD